jgi:hypothetical protein
LFVIFYPIKFKNDDVIVKLSLIRYATSQPVLGCICFHLLETDNDTNNKLNELIMYNHLHVNVYTICK